MVYDEIGDNVGESGQGGGKKENGNWSFLLDTGRSGPGLLMVGM